MANVVGPMIKEARTKAGFTQEQLAKKVNNVTAQEISKAERGELELTQTVLREIAKATGVTQTSLVEAAKKSTYGDSKSTSKTTTSKTSTAKTSTAKTSTAKTSAAKTSTTKTTTAKTSSSKSSDDNLVKLTDAEKTMLSAYRRADAKTKKAALAVLKGEKVEIPDILPSLMGNLNGISGLSGLTDLFKNAGK